MSDFAKLLYGDITFFTQWGSVKCFVSNETLCQLIGKKQSAITSAIKELKNEGFIETTFDGRKRYIQLVHEIDLQKQGGLREYLKEHLFTNQPSGKSLDTLAENHYHNNIDKNIVKVSKDTSSVFKKNGDSNSKDSSESIPKKNALIDFWNSLNGAKHRDTSTKTYRRATILLNQLRNGTFLARNQIDKGFLDKNKIKFPADKNWDRAELRQGMRRLSNLLTGGYWPQDKSRLPKDLPSLLYNPQTGTSLFLMVMANEPKLINANANEKALGALPSRMAEAFDAMFELGSQRGQFVKGLQSILKFHQRMITLPDEYHNIRYWFREPHKLCEDYARWLAEQDWLDTIQVSAISAESKLWDKYITEQEKSLQTKLR